MSGAGRMLAALRPATVVAAGSFAVHQLAYLAGYGGDASHALEHHGHGYLTGLVPVLAILAALTLLAAVESGISGSRPAPARRPPLARALTYAAAILVVVVVQELAEGVLLPGHPGPFAWFASPVAMFATPFAIASGALAWLAVRGLEGVEAGLAARFEPVSARAPRSRMRRRGVDLVLSPAALAGGGTARAPPSV